MTEAVRLKPGDVIQDSYVVERLLGEGGMGATYQGRNLANGHAVAIKVVTGALSGNERALQLFKRESALLRTVQNDAVIRYETMLQDRQGRLYLIMEYVEGQPLSHYIRRGARLPAEDVLALGARLADGLAAIHALNIVHRDISPDNIIVPGDDIQGAKLIDFGLASDTIGTEQSIVGDSFAGKVSYCAPEQLGLFGGKVTAATDVYALGLVLLRVAGLPVPGEGRGMAGAVEARRSDINVQDGRLPPALARTLEAMLRAESKDRPEDPRVLFSAARSGAGSTGDHHGVLTPQVGRPDGREAAAGPASRSRWLPLVAGLVLAILLAAGAWIYLRPGPAQFSTEGAGGAGQAATAEEIIATSEDPIRDARALIDSGGTDNLNVALAVLMHLGRNVGTPTDMRQQALLEVAHMQDPGTFDPVRSPFPQPNASAAARHYRQAADLGSAEARDALERLEE